MADTSLAAMKADPAMADFAAKFDADLQKQEIADEVFRSLSQRRIKVKFGEATFDVRHPGAAEFARIADTVKKLADGVKNAKDDAAGAIMDFSDKAGIAISKLLIPGVGLSERDIRTNEYGLEIALSLIQQVGEGIKAANEAAASFPGKQ